MKDYAPALKPASTYHIYNRAHGKEALFLQQEHYKFFIYKYKQYIVPIADTFCYCLMPNHFHFLIRFKDEDQLNLLNMRNDKNSSEFLSSQFQHFFNSYSKAFNKQQGRKGSLFMRPFKRKKVNSINYFRKIVHYIHFNPVVAELCRQPHDWNYSSFRGILSSSSSLLQREELISVFENLENFLYVHQHPPALTGIESVFNEI
jgi:putative transposase